MMSAYSYVVGSLAMTMAWDRGKNCSIDVFVYQCKQINKLAAKARVDVKELLKTGPKEQVLDSRRKV